MTKLSPLGARARNDGRVCDVRTDSCRTRTRFRRILMGGSGVSRTVDARERELLTGMGNCFEACGEDFEGTVGMVADARHRRPEEVKATLVRMREKYQGDPDYQALRRRLPEAFPL